MSAAFPAIPPEGPLEPMRARRDALESAATDLDRSLAGASASPAWRDGVRTALGTVTEAVLAHLAEVDSERGIPASVTAAEPRLSGPASRLDEEHPVLTEQLDAVRRTVDDSQVSAHDVQAAGAGLVALLRIHVQHANDLLYDAMESELGGSD